MRRSYQYRGFGLTYGTCKQHPNRWEVRDWRGYDELMGSRPSGICALTIQQAKQQINDLIFVQDNIPF